MATGQGPEGGLSFIGDLKRTLLHKEEMDIQLCILLKQFYYYYYYYLMLPVLFRHILGSYVGIISEYHIFGIIHMCIGIQNVYIHIQPGSRHTILDLLTISLTILNE